MKILVISPTYNEKKNIKRLVDMVLGDNPEFGLLIVDDNSPDNTAKIAEDYFHSIKEKSSHTINVIKRKAKNGLSSAILNGIQEASANTIVVMDSDFSHPPSIIPKLIDAIKQTRQELDSSKSLIGFAGAPYTLCKYMTQTKDQNVVDKLVPFIVEHLVQQIKAGCDTIQIFDSWAGDLTEEELDTLCYFPTAHIVSDIRELYPEVSIIAFPRLIGKNINDFANVVIPDCINLSDDIPVEDVTTKLVLQGGIPINELLVNGDITPMLQKMKDKPYVVNLAHGVNKETPVENVRNFVQTVKDFR